MRRITILVALLLGISTTLLAAENIKRYDVRSGIITYEITHSGNMMGIKTEGKGEAKTAFKEWGSVELHTEKTQTTTMGHTEKTHEMTKFDNGKVYVVDFGENVIYEYTAAMLATSEHKDLLKTGKETLTAMGAKKIAEEKFMGYACEVWEMMHVKIWMHKGVMLKTEADVMGMKHITLAKEIQFDLSIPDAELQLPKLPIKQAEQGRMPGEMEKEEPMPKLTPEQMLQMQEMMRNFSKRSER